ncbi:hypothetical protein CAEBREN_28257 [Caenorhabditis brenneri]|uniref:BTB domain-containing protein n=1 Tax=Caenorhabditis brenneri TaxID=135651 RepID=G0MD29_CAEBE|nr:hypothetical protein CAEBREN_28257 [Caenorhabditis brenneri]
MGEPFKPFTLTLIVGDISDWESYGCRESKELLQYNVPWKLEFKRTDPNFSVFLKCGRNAENEEWSIKVKLELTLSSTTGKTYVEDSETNFTQGSAVYGTDDFITSRRLNEEFVYKDQLILDAKVTILEMNGIEKKKKLINFDDEDSRKLSDVTLCIGNEKFYVLKQLLARQSPYFHSMFFKDFKEATMEEVPLKDERVFNDLRTKTDIRAATDPDLKNPEILRRLLDLAIEFHF